MLPAPTTARAIWESIRNWANFRPRCGSDSRSTKTTSDSSSLSCLRCESVAPIVVKGSSTSIANWRSASDANTSTSRRRKSESVEMMAPFIAPSPFPFFSSSFTLLCDSKDSGKAASRGLYSQRDSFLDPTACLRSHRNPGSLHVVDVIGLVGRLHRVVEVPRVHFSSRKTG